MDDIDGEFGAVLFRPRPGRQWKLGALGLLPTGLVLMLSPLAEFAVRAFIAPGLLVAGVACFFEGRRRDRSAVVVYEKGVVAGAVRLPFDAVETMTVDVVQFAIEDISAGIEYVFHQTGPSGESTDSIQFQWGNLGSNTERVDDLIGRISPTIERRMAEELLNERPVPFGSNCLLQKNGIQFVGQELVPFSQIRRFEFRDGRLQIGIGDHDHSIAATEPDFYPGYRLVAGILARCGIATDDAERLARFPPRLPS